MLKHFIKYQSLGNDFVLYDWYKKPTVYVQNTLADTNWASFIQETCNRHFGIGADGVLIIKSNPEASYPEMLIFNADGSQAQMCMNGIRCVAHYLFTQYGLQKTFNIKMGQQIIECSIIVDKNNESAIDIVTNLGSASYLEKMTLQINEQIIEGHVVEVGNPHLIVFQQIEPSWLSTHGKYLEQHPNFPNRTNVEFAWEDKTHQATNTIQKLYNLLVYERGCGITLACSSGVAATLWTLFYQGLITQQEKIAFRMPGGTVIGSIGLNKNIVLQATATMVFRGDLEHKE